jgi:hypothetical protein
VNPRHRIYFVDTSYLLELYKVPDCFDETAALQVRKRFEGAWRRGDRLFVPIGCLLEYGNHVANIKNQQLRENWARLLHKVVVDVLDPKKPSRPFTLTEAPEIDGVELLVRNWCDKHVSAPRGLVDAAIAEKAAAFKRERSFGNPVHIWTRDRRLKGVEPDPEPNPFV